MKKSFLSAVLIVGCLLLASCSEFGINISDSLSPPKPSGELYDIQQTLEASVGHDVDLVYPSSGEYRSAIITKDIDSDGKSEVFSFYGTETDDKTTVMHINYIRWIEEKWVSVTDLQVDASGIESIEFVRLDHSLTPKILVNWNRYSAANKQLSVYSIDSGNLTEVTKAEYSVYSACDFDSDGISEIVAIHIDSENKVSSATLMGLNADGFSEISSCQLDGTVTSYYTPVLSKLTDGTPALFIDADKATGMITEVLYVTEDNVLTGAFPYTSSFENVNTMRASSVRSSDYDHDGCIDIPLAQRLPTVSGSPEDDAVYMTIWNSFDGKELTAIGHTVINFTDGYYINMPDAWVGNLSVERRLDSHQRVFYRWDPLLLETGEEIMRVQVVSVREWEQNGKNYDGFTEYARTSENVFILKFGNSALTPDKQYFRKNFKLMNTETGNKTGKPD